MKSLQDPTEARRRKNARRPKGIVFYRGPSMLDGSPIVAIATLKSSNRKVGDAVQTWILCADQDPISAIACGADYAICGDCKHRPILGKDGDGDGECYVNAGQAPRAVYYADQRGLYPDYDPALHDKYIAGRVLRAGSYGDPAAVPIANWDGLRAAASKTIGYTHQWRMQSVSEEYSWCQASVDSAEEYNTARSIGLRTFRVIRPWESLEPHEINCPSDRGINCVDCALCCGTDRPRAKNIVILAHGPKSGAANRRGPQENK